jgi:putative transcriptional regulator
MILTGKVIRSTSFLNETYFENTSVLITEHNKKGAIGFVTNRPFGRSLSELEEFKTVKKWPLFEGGPVDQEHIFILHRSPDLIQNGKEVYKGTYAGGDMKDVVHAIQHDLISEDHLILFIGYCGWNQDELEKEIEEGSWEVIDPTKA